MSRSERLQHEINFGKDGITNSQIKGNIYRIGSILMVRFLLICVTLLKVYNVQPAQSSKGYTYFKEIYGNYPDILFITTFIVSVFVILRLIMRSKK